MVTINTLIDLLQVTRFFEKNKSTLEKEKEKMKKLFIVKFLKDDKIKAVSYYDNREEAVEDGIIWEQKGKNYEFVISYRVVKL